MIYYQVKKEKVVHGRRKELTGRDNELTKITAHELWTTQHYLADAFAYTRYWVIKIAVTTRISIGQESFIITNRTDKRESGRRKCHAW